MKKIISMVLALILAVSMLSVAAVAADITTVATEDELRAAAASGGEITVSSHIAVYTPIDVTSDLTINLSDMSSIQFPSGINGETDYLFNISGATLTINSLSPYSTSVRYSGKGSTYKLSGGSDSRLIINGGSHSTGTYYVVESGGFAAATSLFTFSPESASNMPVITLNGGSFTVEQPAVGENPPTSNGPLLSGNGALVVKGGNFSVDPTEHLHTDSICYQSDGFWQALTIANTYSDNFKKFTNDKGELTVNRYKPTTEFDFFALFDALQMGFDAAQSAPFFRLHYNSYNEKDCTLYASLEDEQGNYIETHKIKFIFKYDTTLKSQVDALIASIPKGEDMGGYFAPYTFKVTDLEVVNYWLTCDEQFDNTDKLINYSDEFKKLIGYKNFRIDARAGDGDYFYTFAEGFADFRYGESVIGSTQLGVQADHILYVSDDTENTPEAITAAAKKRIDEYLGNNEIKITFIDTVYGVLDADHFDNTGVHLDPTLTGEDLTGLKGVSKDDYCFALEIGEVANTLIVKRGSDKMLNPTYQNIDVKTDVSVSAKDGTIPLDTMLEVETLTSGTEYERVMKALDVKESSTFDIKLHSASTDSYVTRLENGKFEVRLPISDELSGKELEVYYVDTNGKITKHDVEVDKKNNYATFTTNHFSIYTLAASGDSPYTQSPATGDSAAPIAVFIAALCTAVLTLKKVNN